MMKIFFVFNTSFCKSDEDDPKDALVYFYPTEVCDTQRYELCFQLVGVSQFLKSTFTSPLVVSLDHGKFAFHRSQNYLLVLGGSSAMNSTLLKEQLQFLCRIFSFYFKDINSVLNVCGNDRSLFLQKMREIWDQVLLTSKIFGNVTHLASSVLPVATFSQKKASSVRFRAKQLLHLCQRNPPVIAGAVFCDELLVYSQLTPELTKNLVLVLSFQDCAALHSARVTYRLPPGVKMKRVYLTRKEISSILKHNHMNVGSQIRYQTIKKIPISPCGTASLSSGSEGDVDSGNSSEAVETQRSDNSVPSCPDSQSGVKTEHSLPHNSDILEVCSPYVHSTDNSQDLKKVPNKNFKRSVSTDTEKSYSTAYESAPGNIFDCCKRLSQYLGPTDDGLCKHTVLQRRHSFSCTFNQSSTIMLSSEKNTCCSSELCLHSSSFRTFECTEKHDMPTSGKHSFDILPHFSRRASHVTYNLHAESCYLCLIKNHSLATESLHKGAEKKLQVLKCRLNKRRTKNHSHSTQTSRSNSDRSAESSCNTHVSSTVVPNPKNRNSSVAENIKDFDLMDSLGRQEMFLYVQRYCSCTLFLLLHKSFDEDLLNDLWMYGFSSLGEIELESKKCMLPSNNEKGSDFQICVLNSFRNELSGNPPSIEDGISDAVMQTMHIDLQSNPSLHSVSLFSRNRTVSSFSVLQNEIYYMQPGTVNLNAEVSAVHREPLTQFYKKAQLRIRKYSGISLSEL